MPEYAVVRYSIGMECLQLSSTRYYHPPVAEMTIDDSQTKAVFKSEVFKWAMIIIPHRIPL